MLTGVGLECYASVTNRGIRVNFFLRRDFLGYGNFDLEALCRRFEGPWKKYALVPR